MKYRIANIFLAAIIALLLAVPALAASAARTITGVVSHVTDGDTLWIKPLGGAAALDVRIQGIDAPEICQDYGRAAQQALASHVLNKSVMLTTRAKDKYGRVIAKVSLGNQDVGAWMVSSGHAWSYHYHRSAGLYAKQEAAARQAGRGLWMYGGNVEPRVFRKRTKCKH